MAKWLLALLILLVAATACVGTPTPTPTPDLRTPETIAMDAYLVEHPGGGCEVLYSRYLSESGCWEVVVCQWHTPNWVFHRETYYVYPDRRVTQISPKPEPEPVVPIHNCAEAWERVFDTHPQYSEYPVEHCRYLANQKCWEVAVPFGHSSKHYLVYPDGKVVFQGFQSGVPPW